jgi:CRISPR/Cas system-associated endoribonuclease Cas2
MPKKIDPKKVLSEIREALVKEELAIPLYVSHIQQAFFWSGLSKNKQDQIINRLKILEAESENHVRMFKEIEKIYLESMK